MALRREIVFASDVEVLSVNLTILDDDIVEDTEEMTLVLTPGEGERAVQFPDGGVVRGTILDDDRDSKQIGLKNIIIIGHQSNRKSRSS